MMDTTSTGIGVGPRGRRAYRSSLGRTAGRAGAIVLLSWVLLCAGAFAVSAPVALTTSSAWDMAPSIATDGAGNWAAVWDSDDTTGGSGSDDDILVCYSTDAGLSWTAPALLNSNGTTDTGNDSRPEIAYLDGYWVVVWYTDDTLGDTIGSDDDLLISYGTEDGGTWTWSAPVTFEATAATDTVDDREVALATDGAGNLMCVWSKGVHGDEYSVMASTGSVDASTWTWTTPVAVDSGIPAPEWDNGPPRVAGGGDGTWVAVWTPWDWDWERVAMFSRSTDNGLTWSAAATIDPTPPTDSTRQEDAVVTTDGDGNWVVVFRGYVGDGDPLFCRSTDNGATWSEPVGIRPDYETDSQAEYVPQVLTDRHGTWIALWVVYGNLGGATGTDSDIVMAVSTDEGATWSAPVMFNTDAASESYSDYNMYMATDGVLNWVAVWERPPSPGGQRNILAATFSGICTLAQLQAMQDDLAGDYVLGCNIDASETADWNDGAGFMPIGDSTNMFTGTFDGAGYEITNLHINRPDQDSVGLFGFARLATFQNVGLVNSTIVGADEVGNLVGGGKSLTIENCYAIGDITGRYNTGGLIGFCYGGTISECFTGGQVRLVDTGRADYLGGIVGYSLRDYQISTDFVIQRCYSTADAINWATAWSTAAAGLCGTLQGGDAFDCYARGDAHITTGRLIGGLVGYAHMGTGRYISRCYSTGCPTGGESEYRGGLVGYISGDHEVVSSYWNTETSGMSTSNGGTGKTTAQMHQQATFSGWDFSTVWTINEGVSYPELRALQFPSPRIEQAGGQTDPATEMPIEFVVTFDEVVTGFDDDDSDDVDLDFSNSTATVLDYTITDQGDGKTFNVAVSAYGDSASLVVEVPAGVCRDGDDLPNDDSWSIDNEVIVDIIPPSVDDITRSGGACEYVRSLSVNFDVDFDEAVTGVDVSDFSVLSSTIPLENTAILSVNPESGFNSTYTVTVNTGFDIGTVQLDLIDDGTITDQDGYALIGGDFTAGETYWVDKTPLEVAQEIPLPAVYTWPDIDLDATTWDPTTAVVRDGDALYVAEKGAFTVYWAPLAGDPFCQELATSVAVQSIQRYDPVIAHMREDEAVFRVQFSEGVTGVDETDFSLANSTVDGPSFIGITEVDSQTYLVALNTGAGRGVLQLDVVDDNSIKDLMGNPLGGSQIGDGDFSSGELYGLDKTLYRIGDAVPLPLELEFFTLASLDLTQTTSVPEEVVHDVAIQNLTVIESAISPEVTSGVFVTDALVTNGHPDGYTTITWTFDDGSKAPVTFEQEILISTDPNDTAHPPMPFYITDTSQGTTTAPTVSVLAADFVYVHHNTQIRPQDPGTASLGDETDFFWVDDSIEGFRDLHAYNDSGLVVMHFEDELYQFLGVQVVDIRPYATDYLLAWDLGFELSPQNPVAEDYRAWPPEVTRGADPTVDPAEHYVYQHQISDSPDYGCVFAIRGTTADNQAEVFWMRYSEGTNEGVRNLAIAWPYEMTRYTFDWPADLSRYQLYVRGQDPVGIPVEAATTEDRYIEVMPFTEFEGSYEITQTPDPDGYYETDGPGWALLKYGIGSPPGQDDVYFRAIRSVFHDDTNFYPDQTAHTWPIGVEIMDAYHEPNPYHTYEVAGEVITQTPGRPGYLYIAEGSGETRYDWLAYDGDNGDGAEVSTSVTGQIFPVNTGQLEVWWYNEDQGGVMWPSYVQRYDAQWPHTIGDLSPWPAATTEEVVIARQNGTGPIPYDTWQVYYQNDSARPGFNPNDEHTSVTQYQGAYAAFPLRDDLGSAETSLPYALIQYLDPEDDYLWRYLVYSVVAEKIVEAGVEEYTFDEWPQAERPDDPFEGEAGLLVQAPFPLTAKYYCEENTYVSGPAWEDRNHDHWVRAAADDGGSEEITMQYYYAVEDGFYWPAGQEHEVGDHVPWLDITAGTPGTPINVTYTVFWPEDVPEMKAGDVLFTSKNGLPSIDGRISGNILYQQSEALGTGSSVKFIDFRRYRPVNPSPALPGVYLDVLPSDVQTQMVEGLTYFPQLNPALKPRLVYNDTTGMMFFRGFFVEPTLGEYYVFLNVMRETEYNELYNLSTDLAWREAIDAIYNATQDVIEVPNDSMVFDSLALTTGYATAGGYVTLAFENVEDASPLPIVVEIIKVVEEWHRGEIAVVKPDCPFDERLILMHKGDFAGEPADYEFEWRTLPDDGGTAPDGPYESWDPFQTDPPNGYGANSITIEGPGLFTLSDNWFTCRYRKLSKAWPDDWSEWTNPQLAEGWIKRVVGDINPFTQRASGGGIEGAEISFSSFGDSGINTVVSMISQAGARWTGSVPLNCLNLDDYGLIEIYETVFGRGRELSIDGLPAVDYAPANNALLLVAGRVADLYMLLGNEAYADAADPTIAYGTEDGTYGSESTSIFCFMNQTSNLLEEELALLRGRDDSFEPPVSTIPVHNRLVWNFTQDITGGEVAYALNYNIQDDQGNADGIINEADAKAYYPQGHGDAWGHYLSGIKRYYTLLRHAKYTWVPRSEGVLVGGVAVTVDYMDERKFAQAAAARAKTGAEIMGLTYRQYYTEDPEGQWQGYKDDDPERAWGVSEWGSRAGMGAYFDWVVGNAILPAVDDDPDHTGIQKVDRTTVTELGEIVAAYVDIEEEIQKADIGLNPLGLARDVMPFDIDPTGIEAGKTHFEQIYERANQALENAVTVFNHANNCTQLLRRQADSLEDFQDNVADQEADFNNRLIEIFGYPYAEDIGPTGTYETGYNGPDLYHYDIVDGSDLLQEDAEDANEFTVPLSESYVSSAGDLRNPAAIAESDWTDEDRAHVKHVTYTISNNCLGFIKPDGWTARKAPGEIQLARSDLLQAIGTFRVAQEEYSNLLVSIDSQVEAIEDARGYKSNQLAIMGGQLATHTVLNVAILAGKIAEMSFNRAATLTDKTAQTLSDAMPTTTGVIAGVAAGTISDMTAFARAAAKATAGGLSTGLSVASDIAQGAQLTAELLKDEADLGFEMGLASLDGDVLIGEEEGTLVDLLRQEAATRLEMYTKAEAMEQASGVYLAAVAKGTRVLDERLRFRQETAGDVQDFRYKDMAFRIFRNDALQKYQAQFEMASRYVYLAAKAYDYETNLLSSAGMAGEQFLTDIVRSRALGIFEDGEPRTGGHDPGLSDTMARMWLNFDLVLRGQLGFNNPQTETNRFSLRKELFRSADDEDITTDDEKWRAKLASLVVDDILSLPEFKRFCREFNPHQDEEPGIVIPFSTEVNFGWNFFGWPLGGGDSAYDSTNFATKIRSVGVWLTGYDSLGSGMSNTPRVYLVPVGEDVMRSPTDDGAEIRQWIILDQKLPVPFPIGSGDLDDNPDWLPQNDTLGEIYAEIRKYSSFRAYHDSGSFVPEEAHGDSRLIGRSVWNTQWLLIIPAGTLHADRDEAMARFIYGPELVSGSGVRTGEGVSDILIFFQTYAYSGGKEAGPDAVPSADGQSVEVVSNDEE